MMFYEARVAPIASTRRGVIRHAQLVPGESCFEAFTREAFAGWGERDLPVLLGHDPSKRAGTITSVFAHGDWLHASFVLDGPHAEQGAAYIARDGRVSISFDPGEMDPDFARPVSLAHLPYHWYRRATLNELSLVRSDAIACYQGAEVTRSYRSKLTPAAPLVREAEPEGEVIFGGGPIRRVGIGQIVGVH